MREGPAGILVGSWPEGRLPVPSGPNSVSGWFSVTRLVPLRLAGCTDDEWSIRSPCQRSTHELTPAGHSPAAGSGTAISGSSDAP